MFLKRKWLFIISIVLPEFHDVYTILYYLSICSLVIQYLVISNCYLAIVQYLGKSFYGMLPFLTIPYLVKFSMNSMIFVIYIATWPIYSILLGVPMYVTFHSDTVPFKIFYGFYGIYSYLANIQYFGEIFYVYCTLPFVEIPYLIRFSMINIIFLLPVYF